MIEAYKVTTNLTIKGNATTVMKQFAALTVIANKNIKSLLKGLKLFSKDFTKIAKDLQILNPEFRNLNHIFTTLNPKMDRTVANFSAISYKIRSLIPEVAALRSELGGISAARPKISMGGGIERRAANAELGTAGGFIAGAGGHHLMALGAAGVAGMSAVHGFGQLKTYEQNLNILRFQGFSGSQINRIRGATGSPPTGFSQNDLLQAYVASLMATQSFKGAQSLMLPLAKTEYIAKGSFGGMTGGQLQDIARVAELRGHGKTKLMQQWLEVATKMMALSGGTLKPENQKGFFARNMGAVGNITPLGYLTLEPVLQAIKGSTVGQALRTFSRGASGGMGSNALTKATIGWYKMLGLWDNKAKGTKYGAMKPEYLKLLQSDPFQFVEGVLVPALKKKGFTSESQIQTQLTHVSGGGLASSVFYAIHSQAAKELRTRATAGKLLGTNQMFGLTANSPAGAINSLTAAWNNFTLTLVRTVNPIIIPTLNFLTRALNNLSSPGHGGAMKMSSTLAPWGAKPNGSLFDVHVHLDTHELATAVTKVQHKNYNAAGTQASTSSFNTGIGQTPSPLNYSGFF